MTFLHHNQLLITSVLHSTIKRLKTEAVTAETRDFYRKKPELSERKVEKASETMLDDVK